MRSLMSIGTMACLLLSILLLLSLTASSEAKKKVPVTVYIVNDTEEKVAVVWEDRLKDEGEAMVPTVTGPIVPGTNQVYKSYGFPGDRITLHKWGENCRSGYIEDSYGTQKRKCQSAEVTVGKVEASNPTSVVVLHPDFTATSEALANPDFLRKAVHHGESIDAMIHVLNKSGRDIDLYWVSPDDKSFIAMSEKSLETRERPHYFKASVYHQFVVRDGSKLRYFRVTGKLLEITVTP